MPTRETTDISEHIPIEVCIDSGGRSPRTRLEDLRRNVASAEAGGASRIELCADLPSGGLTPDVRAVEAARSSFGIGGLMVMIRPRAGNFVYSTAERSEMRRQIDEAAGAGADGVVVGVTDSSGRIPRKATLALAQHARSRGLLTTFHRAFDAARDPLEALETCIQCGIDRILTAGIPWQQPGIAIDGLRTLERLVAASAERVEIVVAGGISADDIPRIINHLGRSSRISFHAHGSAHVDGRVSKSAVADLVSALNRP